MAGDVSAVAAGSRQDATRANLRGRRQRAQIWRSVWLGFHRYLGLSVGALLVVAGLTGSVLVFMNELDAWLNPELLTVAVPSESGALHRPIQEILAAAVHVVKPGSRILAIMGPHSRDGVFSLSFEHPTEYQQRVFVDPYRATITGLRNFAAGEMAPSYLMEAIFQMHFTLLTGETGQTVLAIGALLLLVSIITGLVLWWPLLSQWRQAFAIRRPTTPVRFLFDIHKVFSLYPSIVLAAVLLSGVSMNLNEPFVQMTQWFSPTTRDVPSRLVSSASCGRASIGAITAWEIATSRYPGGTLYGIFPPSTPTGVYLVSHRRVPGLSAFWSERWVAIDQYSGVILDVRAPDVTRTAGETFLAWQWPLHSGQAFGWPGRLAVFVSGLACPAIYITGIRIWWRKRRASRPARIHGTERS